MAALVRAREISPVELVDAHLQQIEKLNPKLNAFVVVTGDRAREEARAAEAAVLRGDTLGDLHGVPVTVKDSFDIAGLRTLCGSKFRLGHRAAADAAAVARMRAAGAIVLGKTNCPEFLSNYETDNFITGRSNNPWDLERTPGGSSGGESAAIASFCSAGGIGSDGGGSVRIPAHFCGIAALKSTPGRVSAAGHFPRIANPGGLLGVAGPMARNARDVQRLFSVLAGYDSQDPFSAPVPLRAPVTDGLKVGLLERFYDVPVQPAMREVVGAAARALEGMKIPVEPFRPEGLERAPNLWWFFFGRLPAETTRETIAGREADAHWTSTEFLNAALKESLPSAQDVLVNLAARDAMRAALLRQMEQFPLLLLPACGVTAWRHRERKWETGQKPIGLFEAMMPVTPFNLLGMPAVVIPFGRDENGMPAGVQIVGRPYDEELILEIAIRLEQARGPFPGPPIAT
jgi:amidase